MDLIQGLVSNILDIVNDTLKEKVISHIELKKLEKKLETIFADYEKECDLEKISVNIRRLVPQIINYCKSPNGIELNKKFDEYIDLFNVTDEKRFIAKEMLKKVFQAINSAVNSVRSHDAQSIERLNEQRHDEQIALNKLIQKSIDDIKKDLKRDDTKHIKIFQLYCEGKNRRFLENDERNLHALQEIYAISYKDDFVIQLFDNETNKIYEQLSFAIYLFIISVKRDNCGMKGMFYQYCRNQEFLRICWDESEMIFDRNLWIAGVCDIISNLISVKSNSSNTQNDSFDAYTYVNNKEFSFLFHIPTFEMKQYCKCRNFDYRTFHLSRYGYYVLDLSLELIFKYVIANFYLQLSRLNEKEIFENPKLLRIENYAIGPH